MVLGEIILRTGEHEDDVVLSIIDSESDKTCWYRCGCKTRRVYNEELELWDWGYSLCFEHVQMRKKSPELFAAYFAGLMKIHRIATGD